MPKFVFLATDLALYAQLLMLALYVVHAWRTPLLRQTWRYVQRDATAMACSVILGLFMLIAVLDSVHFRPILPALPDANAGAAPAYSMQTLSVLDAVLSGQRQAREKTYSRPMATHQFAKESLQRDGVTVRDYPRLQFGGRHLQDPAAQWAADLIALTARGLAWGGAYFPHCHRIVGVGTGAAAHTGVWRSGAGGVAWEIGRSLARHRAHCNCADFDRILGGNSLAPLPCVGYRPDGQ